MGPTADMGGQLVLPVGFTLGGSIGMRYRFVTQGDIHALTLPPRSTPRMDQASVCASAPSSGGPSCEWRVERAAPDRGFRSARCCGLRRTVHVGLAKHLNKHCKSGYCDTAATRRSSSNARPATDSGGSVCARGCVAAGG